MEKFTSKIPNIIYIITLCSIILLGITYKTDIYLHADGLFYDEAALILNIKERSFLGLFLPLGYSQCAPAFFLALQKIIYSIFGLKETALYFIPYLSGVLTLILGAIIGNKIFKIKSLNILFLTLLTLNTVINDYSQKLKQYSSDMFFAVLILFLFLNFKDKIESKKSILITGFLAGLMCFISYPSQFIILPMIGYLIFKLVKNNKKELIKYLIFPYITLISMQFFILVIGTLSDGVLTSYWKELEEQALNSGFISTIIFLVDGWGINVFSTQKTFIIGFLFFAGIIELCTKEKLLAYLLITPFILNIISGMLGLYPFADRVILYLAPFAMIICLKAFDFLNLKNKKTEIIFFLVFLAFFIISYDKRRKPFYNGENYYYFICANAREFVNKLNTIEFKENDMVILDGASNEAFQLYDKENKYLKSISYERNIGDLDEGQHFYIYYNTINPKLPEVHYEAGKWIENEATILYKDSDLFGDFLYIKK